MIHEYHTEKIIRLPRCFIAWQPTDSLPEGRILSVPTFRIILLLEFALDHLTITENSLTKSSNAGLIFLTRLLTVASS